MEKSTLKRLVQDYLDGKIGEEQMYDDIQAYSLEEVKQCFSDAMEMDYLLSKKYLKVEQEVAYRDFLEQIKLHNANVHEPKIGGIRTLWKYAAIFIGVVGLGLALTFLSKSNSGQENIIIANEEVNLHLGNGKLEVIKEKGSANIMDNDGNVIAVQSGDKIKYKSTVKPESIRINELNVPYGKKFQLELADGTIVYVNSGSVLRYPTSFATSDNRQVSLKGEAFFKVAEDKEHPFIVNSGSVNVRVLGTEFNVSAYDEDLEASTVLVSGSVQLYDSLSVNKEKSNVQLLPGERGTWRKDHQSFRTDMVDTSIYTSWVEGKLIFRDMPFKQIRKQLERRYNVTIVNKDTVLDNNTFSANFEEESIEEILEILDRTYGIEYTVINNKIIIK
ncbi:FecR family protein [Arenibacter aquaticus]|uniref:FecR family protein n=1 Tax=Arenibacter aquaticus TaxID=2489054 RepID=A0A3S0ACE2_9FLAO|nr:FecR family protein [Arenibacter aquaticus]RTE52275.1 FecR family protein [Arenibacter aquaticus]